MIRKIIFKIIIVFSIIIMAMILIIINDYRDRMIETKYYENAFLIYFNEGPWGIKTKGEYSDFQSKLKRIDDYKVVISNIEQESISDCIKDYINCILLANNLKIDDWYYEHIEFRNKGVVVGKLKDLSFIKASLSEIKEEITSKYLCDILEKEFDHASGDLYEDWLINKYKHIDIMLPGGIRFVYNPPKKKFEKRINFNRVEILNPIYNINFFNRKKKYNHIKMKVYLDNSNKTHEFTLVYIKGSYDLSEYFYEVYGGYPYDFKGRIRIYCPMEKKYEEESFKAIIMDRYGGELGEFIPDAVHNACIGNYSISTFNSRFKTKLQEEGFLNNYKIKDTIKIDIDNSIQGKELRKLILDDEKGTEIMCLFKIIYPDIDEGYDYEGGGPEEVGDILTYIIPEDKMNLTYEEMYQLAFND